MVDGQNSINGTQDENVEVTKDESLNPKDIIDNPQVEILNESDVKKKRKPVKIVSTTSLYSGPLPSPECFEGYEKVCPGAADRIISMAENESRHRHTMEDNFLKSRIKNSYAGLWMAFVMGIAIIACGLVCILLDHSVSGTIFGGLGITTIIATFLQNTKLTQNVQEDDSKEAKDEKQKDNTNK